MRQTDPENVRKFLKDKLPPEVFNATPGLAVVPLIHVCIVAFCIWAISKTDSYLYLVLLSMIAGHSMFCIANFGHYLSHKSVIKNKHLCYLFETFIWGTNMSSATVWTRAHNNYHHKYTNGTKDTFRYYSKGELNKVRKIVHFLISPSRYSKYNPLVLLTYLVTHAEYMNAALTNRSGTNSNIVPYLSTYKDGDKRKIYAELAVIILIQIGVYFLIGQELLKYLLFAGISIFVSSGVASIYLFTQHSMYNLSDVNDPLRNSTSLTVPKFIDFIHLNVSHHVEHHIFASMSPKYLPHVKELLMKHYRDLYMCVRLSDIWGDIFSGSPYKEFSEEPPSVEPPYVEQLILSHQHPTNK